MGEITDLTLKRLETMTSKLPDDMPTFRGVSVDKFEKPELINICRLFANEMHKYQEQYLQAIRRIF